MMSFSPPSCGTGPALYVGAWSYFGRWLLYDAHGELADRGDDRADEAPQDSLPARDGHVDDVVRHQRDVLGLMLIDRLEVYENLPAARAVRLLTDDAHALLLRVGHRAADHRYRARDGQAV